MIHQLAICSGRRVLTKCGIEVESGQARAFHPTCPDCQDRTRYPSTELQKEWAKKPAPRR